MPEAACTEILGHGFQKGSGRVGRSQKLENRLKVQLAVNAHIRHRLTLYDSILAADKGQDAKLTAREMVYSQVQAIADSWRATSSRAGSLIHKTSAPRGSAATLEANRQRRTLRDKAQANESQVLERALDGLCLNGKEREAGQRPKAAQRHALKVARKKAKEARKAAFREATRDQRRPNEPDPSIKMTKAKRKEVLRLQKEQKGRAGRNRKLRLTANGVELEPIEPDTYVPNYEEPSDEEPRKPRLLRSNYRPPGNTSTNSSDLADAPSDGMKLDAREQDLSVSARGPNSSVDPPRNSRYPLRRNRGRASVIHTDTEEGPGPVGESASVGRLLVEEPEWMDIDEISSRTKRVHLT